MAMIATATIHRRVVIRSRRMARPPADWEPLGHRPGRTDPAFPFSLPQADDRRQVTSPAEISSPPHAATPFRYPLNAV